MSLMSGVGCAEQPTFRFDKDNHEYYLGGVRIPHLTEMLRDTGWIDEIWFTEEGCERGSLVHTLCADYDLGALRNPLALECLYKGWVLAHEDAMRTIKPQWTAVEQAVVSRQYRYGCRPDRVGRVWGAWAVVEVKTGSRHRSTPIQTALQAIAVAPELHLPATAIVRYELDLRENGKWFLFEHHDKRDFDKAYEVIQACCTGGVG